MNESVQTVRDQVLIVINTHYPITAVSLVLKVMELVGMTRLVLDDFNAAVAELIHENEIVEVRYVLPNMDYREKSIYFPKNTVVRHGKI